MADQPLDNSQALADIYTAALAAASIGGFQVLTDFEQFPLAVTLPAILVGQTFFNSQPIENGWLRTQERRPNEYTAWVLLARVVPGTSFAASVALYHRVKPVIMRALNTRRRQTLNGVARLAGIPYAWQNDAQGPFVNFLFENFVGAAVTCGVYEQEETIVNDE